MTKPALKLPDSKGGWASLFLGISLFFAAGYDYFQGDYEQMSLDLAGAFGTLGLPAIFGKGYHVEIKKDVPIDTSPPKGFEGVGRLTETNDDIDGLVAVPDPDPDPHPRTPRR